jgi:Tfp pilus assembly ATPase PilU
MELKDLLKVMVDKDGSDLFLSTGAPQYESPWPPGSHDG